MNKKGKFIVFEGIDGSGKSTQLHILAERMSKLGRKCHETLEPTYGPIGSLLHNILSGRIKADPKVIAGLFVSDRLDHLLNETDGICGKIDSGITVLCDRYYFSSYAYQGVDVPLEWVLKANSLCADTLKPDLTVFIDVAPERAMKRINSGRTQTELFENTERLTAVRQGYMEIFEKLKNDENIVIIDGSGSVDKISERVFRAVSPLFELE